MNETCCLNTSPHYNVTTPILDATKGFPATNTANAFQVYQAIYTAYLYSHQTLGLDLPSLRVVYPIGGNVSNYDDDFKKIEIVEAVFSSWDVIMHEYGHHVAYSKGIVADNTWGSHSHTYDAIANNGKSRGCNLAWSEGWATFYGIAAQAVTGAQNLGVPGVGDARYQRYTTNGIDYSIETGQGLGEGNELAVSAVLWDLADMSSSPGSQYESFETLNLGFNTVINYTFNYKKTSLPEFLNKLYEEGVVSTTATDNYYNIGAMLGKQRIAASNLACDESCIEFSFTTAYGSTLNPITYYLEIYHIPTMSLLYSLCVETSSSNNAHVCYIPTMQVLTDLYDGYTGVYKWRIKAVTINAPTATYCSEFQEFSFTEWK